MASVWHYKDEEGTRCEEQLDDVQASADVDIVQKFQGLEAAAGAGIDLSASKAHAEQIGRVLAGVSGLPKQRQKYWRAELRRIGVDAPEPKTDKKAADAANTTTITAEARK